MRKPERLFAGLVVALALALPASADAPLLEGEAALAALAAQVEKAPVVRADFRQQRNSKAMSRPLVSEGRMVVAGETGLLWLLEEPFPMQLAITPDRLVEREEGMPPRVLPLDSQPVFSTFTSLFLGLLANRSEGVNDMFEARVSQDEKQWHLTLTPRDANLRRAIEHIEVKGGRFIEAVLVSESSGDSTLIRFTQHRTQPADLTAAEKEAFGG